MNATEERAHGEHEPTAEHWIILRMLRFMVRSVPDWKVHPEFHRICLWLFKYVGAHTFDRMCKRLDMTGWESERLQGMAKKYEWHEECDVMGEPAYVGNIVTSLMENDNY